MEYLSQYEYTITYINGNWNTVADALSWLPNSIDEVCTTVAAVFSISSDPKVIAWIKNGYCADPWCRGILDNIKCSMLDSKMNISLHHGLLFIGTCLIIPKYKNLQENLFQLTHDNLGYFGSEKSYASLCNDFYWPNMCKNLTQGYVPSCSDCQRNKLRTSKTPSPLHPLPVPDRRFDSVAIDFVGPLPKDEGFDAIITMTDRLGADIQIMACHSTITAEDFAYLFFDRWYCENGCPLKIISDRDKVFISKFWQVLMKLTGINHKLST